jgi:predicted RND superfamily exporter protein
VAKKSGVISMAGFLAGEQTAKLHLIGEIKQELAGIQFNEPDLRPVNIPELSLTLYSLYGYLGLALDDMGTNQPALGKQLASLRNAVEDLRKELYLGDAAAQEARAQKLAAYQQALFNDVRETFRALQHQDNSAPLRAEDLPKALRDRFVGVTGKYLLQVYPEKDVWQRENQKEFIAQLRTIDPDVTGTPVQLFEYTELLKRSYEQAALYSLGAIVILVIIHFRSLSSVVLSLLPVAIGSIWLGGLMGYFNIPFNPANIMTLPLVLGIGVTNGIHILNRFAEEQHASILARSTGKAVFVSGLTAIAGFGSLVLAQHQGIRSLGYVMAAGVTTCMIAGLTFLPALLNLTLRRRPQIKQPGADNALSTPGREEPRQKDLK